LLSSEHVALSRIWRAIMLQTDKTGDETQFQLY